MAFIRLEERACTGIHHVKSIKMKKVSVKWKYDFGGLLPLYHEHFAFAC